MKKYFGLFILVFITGILFLTSCRPPEIEGIVVNMQQGLYDKAFELAQESVEKYPDNPEAWYLLGTLHGRKENFLEMNEAFEKSLSLGSKFEGDIERERFNYFAENYNDAINNYYNRAREEQNEENQQKLYTVASEKFLKAFQADPTRNEPLTPMAVSYLNIGDTTTAIKYMNTAIEMRPDNDTLMVTVGNFFYDLNMSDQAKNLYEKALEVNSNNTSAHLALGQIYSDNEEWDKAIKEFDTAAQGDPNNSAIPFNIAIMYYNNQKYAEALPYIEKTIKLDPQNKDMHELLSISKIQLAQKALDQFNETEQQQYQDNAQKIYRESISFLEDAVQKFPDSALLWNNLGVCYAQTGQKDKAEKAFEKQKTLEGN